MIKPGDYIWGLLSMICLAIITPLGKIVLQDITPQTVLFFRYTICLVLIILSVIILRETHLLKVPKSQIPILILTGITFSLETAFYWIALETVSIIPFLSLFWIYPLMLFSMDVVSKEITFNYKIPIILALGSFGVFLAWGGF